MNFLQYKSDEMYSSTQLIRTSKMIFDKLSKNEIEKAIILRDGKPSFLLMDFSKYEEIMLDYMKLKEAQLSDYNVNLNNNPKNENKKTEKISVETTKKNTENLNSQKETLNKEETEELNIALKKIDNLDINEISDEQKQELKEFWD